MTKISDYNSLENDRIVGQCEYEDKGLIPTPVSEKKPLFLQPHMLQIAQIIIIIITLEALTPRIQMFQIAQIIIITLESLTPGFRCSK